MLGVQRAEKVFCGGEDAVQLLRQVLWYCATAALCNCCAVQLLRCATAASSPVVPACHCLSYLRVPGITRGGGGEHGLLACGGLHARGGHGSRQRAVVTTGHDTRWWS